MKNKIMKLLLELNRAWFRQAAWLYSTFMIVFVFPPSQIIIRSPNGWYSSSLFFKNRAKTSYTCFTWQKTNALKIMVKCLGDPSTTLKNSAPTNSNHLLQVNQDPQKKRDIIINIKKKKHTHMGKTSLDKKKIQEFNHFQPVYDSQFYAYRTENNHDTSTRIHPKIKKQQFSAFKIPSDWLKPVTLNQTFSRPGSHCTPPDT